MLEPVNNGKTPEDRWAVARVEAQNIGRPHPKPEAKREDASRGSPHDKIEMLGDRFPGRVFDCGEKSSGENLWVAKSQSSGSRCLEQSAAMLPPSVVIKRSRSR